MAEDKIESAIKSFYPYFWRKFNFPVKDSTELECSELIANLREAVWVHRIVSFRHFYPFVEQNLIPMTSSPEMYVSCVYFMVSSMIQSLQNRYEPFIATCSLVTVVAAYVYDKGYHEFLNYCPSILKVFYEEFHEDTFRKFQIWNHFQEYLTSNSYSSARAIVDETTRGKPFADIVFELDFAREISLKIRSKIPVSEPAAVYHQTEKVLERFKNESMPLPEEPPKGSATGPVIISECAKMKNKIIDDAKEVIDEISDYIITKIYAIPKNTDTVLSKSKVPLQFSTGGQPTSKDLASSDLETASTVYGQNSSELGTVDDNSFIQDQSFVSISDHGKTESAKTSKDEERSLGQKSPSQLNQSVSEDVGRVDEQNVSKVVTDDVKYTEHSPLQSQRPSLEDNDENNEQNESAIEESSFLQDSLLEDENVLVTKNHEGSSGSGETITEHFSLQANADTLLDKEQGSFATTGTKEMDSFQDNLDTLREDQEPINTIQESRENEHSPLKSGQLSKEYIATVEMKESEKSVSSLKKDEEIGLVTKSQNREGALTVKVVQRTYGKKTTTTVSEQGSLFKDELKPKRSKMSTSPIEVTKKLDFAQDSSHQANKNTLQIKDSKQTPSTIKDTKAIVIAKESSLKSKEQSLEGFGKTPEYKQPPEYKRAPKIIFTGPSEDSIPQMKEKQMKENLAGKTLPAADKSTEKSLPADTKESPKSSKTKSKKAQTSDSEQTLQVPGRKETVEALFGFQNRLHDSYLKVCDLLDVPRK